VTSKDKQKCSAEWYNHKENKRREYGLMSLPLLREQQIKGQRPKSKTDCKGEMRRRW